MARTVLVRGAGKATGLGVELCRQLTARDDRVWLTARDPAVSDLGGEVLDITDPDSIARMVGLVREGGLDVLINNAAGVAPWGEAAVTADLGVARRVFEVTLWGTWAMCQAFLPMLRQSPADRIVNVSSGAGSHGDAAFGLTTGNGMGTSYAVAKAALNALTVKLAREETMPSVRINAVCPGFTATFPGGAEMGARLVAEGAASILWAADIGNDGPTGGFFRDGLPLAR